MYVYGVFIHCVYCISNSVVKMAILGLLLILCTPFGTAIPLRSFYPFGESAGDTGLGPIDDGSSAAISPPTSFSYYGTSYTSIFVSSFSA